MTERPTGMIGQRFGDMLARVATGKPLALGEIEQLRLLANALQNLIGLASKVDPVTGDITGELRAGATLLGRGGLTAGNGAVTLDSGGITFTSHTSTYYMTWRSADGTLKGYEGVDASDVRYFHSIIGGGYRFVVSLTDATAPYIMIGEDAAQINRAQVDFPRGAQGGKLTIGGDLVIASGGVDGAPDETVFNNDGYDINYRIESDGNANMFLLDAGLNCIGVGGTPTANCVLDVVSTTKAFRPPVMTTTQRDAIPSPQNGMLIWNSTTTQLEDYNGGWAAV